MAKCEASDLLWQPTELPCWLTAIAFHAIRTAAACVWCTIFYPRSRKTSLNYPRTNLLTKVNSKPNSVMFGQIIQCLQDPHCLGDSTSRKFRDPLLYGLEWTSPLTLPHESLVTMLTTGTQIDGCYNRSCEKSQTYPPPLTSTSLQISSSWR
jgi:hypothetical protein